MSLLRFGTPWQEHEDAILLQHWRDKHDGEIASMLSGRTTDAICKRRKKLGLTRGKGFTVESLARINAALRRQREGWPVLPPEEDVDEVFVTAFQREADALGLVQTPRGYARPLQVAA